MYVAGGEGRSRGKLNVNPILISAAVFHDTKYGILYRNDYKSNNKVVSISFFIVRCFFFLVSQNANCIAMQIPLILNTKVK